MKQHSTSKGWILGRRVAREMMREQVAKATGRGAFPSEASPMARVLISTFPKDVHTFRPPGAMAERSARRRRPTSRSPGWASRTGATERRHREGDRQGC